MDLVHLREFHSINGLPVYVVEKHQSALAAWAEEKRNCEAPMMLVTFDFHTDFHPPPSGIAESLDVNNDASIIETVSQIRHDQHIQTALKASILEHAFIISPSASHDKPSNGAPAEDGIYHPGYGCYVGCNTRPHNDNCVLQTADQALDSQLLDRLLAQLKTIYTSAGLFDDIFAQPLIVDIDLDYFLTTASLFPGDATTFHRILRSAKAVTIAIETNYLNDLWLGEPRDDLTICVLNSVLDHIRVAKEVLTHRNAEPFGTD